MNLRTYLATQNIKAADFAGKINVTAASMHRYIAGDRIPRPDILSRIADVTGGAVQPNDFFAFAASERGGEAA